MKNLRERIGLKILRLIDRYVDSFEKRIFIFIIFITMYWLWQNIWQLLLFYKVYFITDKKIVLDIANKKVTISGCNLILKKSCGNELIIYGNIKGVTYE